MNSDRDTGTPHGIPLCRNLAVYWTLRLTCGVDLHRWEFRFVRSIQFHDPRRRYGGVDVAGRVAGCRKGPPAKAKVDFSRAIRPLLANKCLKCHGPGQQQRASELRLDLRKSAIGTAIVPGRPDQRNW
ncbi:MAG: hypothetical protein CM1200mP2_18500 [Planctomycetaceae bacterium]|nr:MAG: hypothetical protein CM1200mP2_18500 [Planctomycetaceae bacterium]